MATREVHQPLFHDSPGRSCSRGYDWRRRQPHQGRPNGCCPLPANGSGLPEVSQRQLERTSKAFGRIRGVLTPRVTVCISCPAQGGGSPVASQEANAEAEQAQRELTRLRHGSNREQRTRGSRSEVTRVRQIADGGIGREKAQTDSVAGKDVAGEKRRQVEGISCVAAGCAIVAEDSEGLICAARETA